MTHSGARSPAAVRTTIRNARRIKSFLIGLSIATNNSERQVSMSPRCSACLAFIFVCRSTLAQTPSFAAYDIPVPPYPIGPAYISDLTAGPDGAIWFGAYSLVGRLDPVTGDVRVYPADANRIISGPDGALWITKATGCGISRVTTTGTVTDVPATFTWCPVALTVGPDNAVWFSTSSTIGKITSSGIAAEYPAGSNDLTTGPDGALWIPGSGISFTPGVRKVTTAGVITQYISYGVTYPEHDTSRITSGPDGALWTTSATSGSIAKITTSGAFTWYKAPGSPSYQTAGEIVTGPDGALWFTIPVVRYPSIQLDQHAIGRIATDGTVTVYPVPDSFGVYPDRFGGMGIITGPDGSLWYGGDISDVPRRPLSIGRVVFGPADTVKPTSRVTALSPTQASASFFVQWTGSDTGFGVRDYDIYVSDNNGPFKLWIHTADKQALYSGIAGHTYGFNSTARDRAGNVEDPKLVAESTTYVPSGGPADINADGVVDCQDVAIVKASFGRRSGQPGFDPRADVNHDNVIDIRDLSFVLQRLVPGSFCR